MGHEKIGPKEAAQRLLRDATYAGKNQRAAKPAIIENLRAATKEREENAGKPREARRKAKKKR